MPRRIALIVGVSQYQAHTGLHNLSAPVNDAQRVYEVLAEYGGFDELYPLPLANGKVDSSGWVTAQELQAKLHEVLNPQLADEVELAVFYFSGHGVNPDGQVAYLSASDKSSAVAISHLAKLAKKSTVNNICIWLDCCHSGEMLEFSDLENKGFCVVAASHADGEALAADGNSLLTNLLCEALTPLNGNPAEIRVMEFIQAIEAKGKNLPQQVVCLARGNTAFTLTQLHGETTVTSPYPPDYPPYKGLLTFTKDDSPFFFGRDGMIQQLLDRLSASRFVPLLGASGSGKSSLVLAGLLPKLPESDWQVLVMRPTAQPLQNLRDTLVRGFPDAQVGTVATGADLQREVSTLFSAGKRLLLVIDQFEEVFTECRDDTARAAFFACLLGALDNDNPLHLVLTLRADFLGHCTEQAYSGLGQHLQQHALLLVAPTAGELREAITRPLALVGMRCEQALEDELVDQTLHAKGSLPLLQYVLEKLWQSARQERSRELTLAMYQQLGGQHGGGLRGVLNEKADAFYQQLEPQQQRLMEWLMVELVQVNDGQEDTRRTVTLQELHNRQPQYTEALDALLAKLVTHERLLTQDHDDQGQATITVAHEALIRDWQRLRGWLESNREIKSWLSRLKVDMADWQKSGGSFLRDGRLAEAQEMLARHPDSLLIGQQEQAFIQVSKQQQQQEQEQAQQQRWALESALQETQRQANIALAGRLAIQAELAVRSPQPGSWLSHGLLLAIQAFRLDATSPVTLAALKNGLNGAGYLRHSWYTDASISAVAFSPDGKFVVCGSKDKTLRLWELASGRSVGAPWQGHENSVKTVAFSPDGKFVVSGSWDKTLRLWEVASGQAVGAPWLGHEDGVKTIAFSPDGKFVVSGSMDKTLRLWEVASGQVVGAPWLGHEDGVEAVAFSPDGKFVVSGSSNPIGGKDYTLWLWELASGRPVGTPWQGHESDVNAVAFSPDGKFVVSGSKDKTLRLWELASGRPVGASWQGHESVVNAVAVSPDGKFVVSGSEDKTLRLWELASGQSVGVPWQGHKSEVTAVAVSPDGKFVVSGSRDETLRRWEVTSGQAVGAPWQAYQANVTAITFSPDGKFVVSGSRDETLRLWEVASGQVVGAPWLGHKYGIKAVTFSPDGKFVVSGSEDKTLRLWEVTSGQAVGAPWLGHKWSVNAVAFSPDGKFVISGSGSSFDSKDNTLRLWEVASGQPVGVPWQGHESEVNAVAFSPDGKFVVSGSGGRYGNGDNTLRLWEVAKGQALGAPWQGHDSWVNAVAFSPDGKFVVSGSRDNTLRLWEVASGQPVGVPWQGHKDWVNSVAFSPDSRYVVSGSNDQTLRLWDADPESWAKKACSIVNRNFSLAEWQRFIGDALPYQKTCPDLPAPGEEGWVEPYAGG